MRDKSLLTNEEYFEAVKKLALANYRFISVDAKTLLWVLKKNGMSATSEVTNLFSLLLGKECSEDSSVTVLADLIKLAWLEPMHDQNRFFILDLALSTLMTNRMGSSVVSKFKTTLTARFALLPLHLKEILHSIQLWSNT